MFSCVILWGGGGGGGGLDRQSLIESLFNAWDILPAWCSLYYCIVPISVPALLMHILIHADDTSWR